MNEMKDELVKAIMNGHFHVTWDGRLILTFQTPNKMRAVCTFELTEEKKANVFELTHGKLKDFTVFEIVEPVIKRELFYILNAM